MAAAYQFPLLVRFTRKVKPMSSSSAEVEVLSRSIDSYVDKTSLMWTMIGIGELA
jgi:hypothetical protein